MFTVALRARSGFNLIEIIVALAIVAIMAIGSFQAFRFVQQGKITKTEALISNVRIDLERFRNDTGSYPTTLEDLIKRPSDAALSRGWRGPYADELPLDGWKQELEYTLNAKGAVRPYELYSWGKNGSGSPEDEWISVWNIQ